MTEESSGVCGARGWVTIMSQVGGIAGGFLEVVTFDLDPGGRGE